MKRIENGGVTSPAGFVAAGIAAGIKASGKLDLAVIGSDRPAVVAGAFTANAFAAAPVCYDRHVCSTRETVRAVVVNAGNANACTGERGAADTREMAAHTAAALGLAETEDVLVCSTGVIGAPLPMARIRAGIDAACGQLRPAGNDDAAAAIMTTDTHPKTAAVAVELAGGTVSIGGMAKGVGMIAPRLRTAGRHATMLAFITSDAHVAPPALRQYLNTAVAGSFNRITVDGDTSTNDTVILLANGAGGVTVAPGSADADVFATALQDLCAHLARMLVRDGEGATRCVEIHVSGAADDAAARACADAVANSLLCKTAWFGADPNWGRVLAAAGYAGVRVDPQRTSLSFGGLPVVRDGVPSATPDGELRDAVSRREFRIDLDLGVGAGTAEVWTCDLSYDYVKINAEYHT